MNASGGRDASLNTRRERVEAEAARLVSCDATRLQTTIEESPDHQPLLNGPVPFAGSCADVYTGSNTRSQLVVPRPERPAIRAPRSCAFSPLVM